MSTAKNVRGRPLAMCCEKPLTGFYRNGYCDTGAGDDGIHVVCARMTAEFLKFSKRRGNDLSTPVPEWGFEGLKPGDCWCLCVARWQEAMRAGVAPPVNVDATHMSALEFVSLEELESHEVDETA